MIEWVAEKIDYLLLRIENWKKKRKNCPRKNWIAGLPTLRLREIQLLIEWIDGKKPVHEIKIDYLLLRIEN